MTICIIGCGKMGEAILTGWIHARTGEAAHLTPADFLVAGHSTERCDQIARRHAVHVQQGLEGVGAADSIVLGVKPQVLPDILEELAPQIANSPHLVISIAAGIPTAAIEAALPAGTRVVRAMPNTPLQIGEGATAVAGGATATPADVQLVCDLFACLGMAIKVHEGQMDAVGAISGAAPAYFSALVEALASAGAHVGLPASTCEALLVQSGLGTFQMMRETGQTPAETRMAVCSPGGTTLAALAAMDEAGFAESIDAGVQAALHRAKELAQ